MAPGPRSRTYACLRASDPTGTLGRRPRALVAALAGVMAAGPAACALAPVPAAGASTPCPTAIAHRGNAVYGGPAENSLGAFQSAFASGATWVETDVLFTSDNVPVLMHDSTVDRTTTGTGAVSGMTAAQFSALTMNDGQQPPTLEQALDLVRADPARRMVMEVKGYPTAAQEQVLLDTLAGLEDRVHVNAFANRLPSVQRLKAANPALRTSLIGYNPVLPAPVGMTGEDLEFSYVTAEKVQDMKAAGLAVRVWVPNTVTAWRNARAMGVDAVMTNSTAAYVAWAATECPAPPAPVDQGPPVVSDLAPPTGSTVTGTVQVGATVTDDVAVTSVSLLVDGAETDSTTPGPDGSVSIGWDSATVPDGEHTLQLRARDAAGNVGESPLTPVTVANADTEAPTPPTSVIAGWSSPSRVTLTWSGATDNALVTGHRVYRDGQAIADVGRGVGTYIDSGVANLVTHEYHLTALDAAGHESEPSQTRSVETGDDTPPSAPTVTAELSGPDAVTVGWSGAGDNVGVAGYVVHRGATVVADVGPTTTEFVDTGLGDGVTYGYRVNAYDAAGNASPLGTAVTVTTPDRTPPTAPGGLTAVSGNRQVTLSWAAAGDNVGVTGYVVHRDGEPLVTLGASARSHTDTGLDDTTAHVYEVTALDAAGLEGPPSASVTRSLADTVPPTAATGLVRTITGYTVRLTWAAASDNVAVTGYTVYRAGVAIGTTTGATTYTDATAPPGKTYAYTVRANDAAGNLGASSASVSATLPADTVKPTAPSGLKAVAGAAGTRRIALTWNAATDNAGVTSYYLYRGNVKYRLLGNVLTFTDTGLTAGKAYTYKVYALDASSNWSTPTGKATATAR